MYALEAAQAPQRLVYFTKKERKSVSFICLGMYLLLQFCVKKHARTQRTLILSRRRTHVWERQRAGPLATHHSLGEDHTGCFFVVIRRYIYGVYLLLLLPSQDEGGSLFGKSMLLCSLTVIGSIPFLWC